MLLPIIVLVLKEPSVVGRNGGLIYAYCGRAGLTPHIYRGRVRAAALSFSDHSGDATLWVMFRILLQASLRILQLDMKGMGGFSQYTQEGGVH